MDVHPPDQAGTGTGTAADWVGIRRLQCAYADAVTCRDWARTAALFAAGATVEIDTVTSPVHVLEGGEAVAEFIATAVERFEFFEFVILNTHVTTPGGGTGSARMFICELRQERASGMWSQAFGRYLDDYVLTDEGWRFAARAYRSMARTGRNEVFPVPTGP